MVRIGAERREGELSHLRLADDHGAGHPQAPDYGRVGRGRRLAAQPCTYRCRSLPMAISAMPSTSETTAPEEDPPGARLRS